MATQSKIERDPLDNEGVPPDSLGGRLVAAGWINEDQITEALEVVKGEGILIGDALVGLKAVPEEVKDIHLGAQGVDREPDPKKKAAKAIAMAQSATAYCEAEINRLSTPTTEGEKP